jgi:hypothetical protein
MMGKYQKDWARKDAELQKQGFPPSKLGPGVPAVTTPSMLGGTRYQDDNGNIIPSEALKPRK